MKNLNGMIEMKTKMRDYPLICVNSHEHYAYHIFYTTDRLIVKIFMQFTENDLGFGSQFVVKMDSRWYFAHKRGRGQEIFSKSAASYDCQKFWIGLGFTQPKEALFFRDLFCFFFVIYFYPPLLRLRRIRYLPS